MLIEVSVASKYACGVDIDGFSTCWGRVPMGSTSGSEVLALAPGDLNLCRAHSDLKIDCSYNSYRGDPPVLPEGDFTAISSGGAYFCAIGTDRAITCWEDDELSGASFDITPPSSRDFASVAAGETHACALKTSGTIECWGENDHGQADPPGIGFVAIDVADGYSCGVRQDGGIECWGDPFIDESKIPEGTFVDISTGPVHACALRNNGGIACWFPNFVPRPDTVPLTPERPSG